MFSVWLRACQKATAVTLPAQPTSAAGCHVHGTAMTALTTVA
jgi:hypothetical protein